MKIIDSITNLFRKKRQCEVSLDDGVTWVDMGNYKLLDITPDNIKQCMHHLEPVFIEEEK